MVKTSDKLPQLVTVFTCSLLVGLLTIDWSIYILFKLSPKRINGEGGAICGLLLISLNNWKKLYSSQLEKTGPDIHWLLVGTDPFAQQPNNWLQVEGQVELKLPSE